MATCKNCECYTRCTSEWHKLNKVENVCGHFKRKSVWFGLKNEIKFWFIRTFKTRNCRMPKGETKFAWLGKNNELKPCKYCGGKPQLIPVGDFREYYAYRCSNCGEYHAQFGEARCTIRGAKKVWNRRATDDK